MDSKFHHKPMNLLCMAAIVMIAACNGEPHIEMSKVNEGALQEFLTAQYPATEGQVKLDILLDAYINDSSSFVESVSYLDKKLGNPNSTYRNEALYSALLSKQIQSSFYDDATKAKLRKKLFLVLQNRPGSPANDFVYVTPSGMQKTMYDLKAKRTLLLFYNPECGACKDMRETLSASTSINAAIADKELEVLAIYTDKDEKIWLDHLAEMPVGWKQGRDETAALHDNSVYDLKAIPSLYLLDEQKNVLLKDCMNVSEIEKQLITKQL